jgi:hypothetical protein
LSRQSVRLPAPLSQFWAFPIFLKHVHREREREREKKVGGVVVRDTTVWMGV